MTKILLVCLLLLTVLLAGCTQTVSEVTAEDSTYVGENVAIKGSVQGSFKFGDLSGYTLTDENEDSIFVSSSDLPEDGSDVTARGVLKKGPLGLGFYVDAKE